MPSAVRIAARLSRSARICFSIESWMEGGGSMALSSTRLTRMPQLAGGLVEDAAQGRVDLLAGGQGPLEVHAADDVAQRGDGELLDRLDVAGDLVGRGARVGHLVVDDGVDVDDQVVLGDHRLRRERDDLLAQVDAVADGVDERHHDVEARAEGPRVAAEALDDGRRWPVGMTWTVLIRAMKTNTTRMIRTMMTGSIVVPVPFLRLGCFPGRRSCELLKILLVERVRPSAQLVRLFGSVGVMRGQMTMAVAPSISTTRPPSWALS